MADISGLFQKQNAYRLQMAQTTAKERQKMLQKLIDAVGSTWRQRIQESMSADFGKPIMETDITEIFATVSELKHTKRNLRHWIQQRSVSVPLPLIGSSSWVKYEPKGSTLIISPWNFPVLLTIGPLASAIAAGCTAILKPSELTPHTSDVIEQMIHELFPPEQVAVVQGGVETSTELLAQPFDHIFFTGSPQVGKIVMAAAAKHLTSVTLELGGKSPTIIDETANLQSAARRVAWAKLFNAGQVCIAPDYVLVHESVKNKFVQLLQQEMQRQYGEQPVGTPFYTDLVSEKHLKRTVQLVERSLEQGGTLVSGGNAACKGRSYPPTVILEPKLDSPVMQEEIFAPVLPIIGYTNLYEAVQLIQEYEKPLALYIFSSSRKNIRYVTDHTSAGTTAINHCAVQFFNAHLPFGGVRYSGQGKGHGHYGFLEFSNARSVLRQHTISITDILGGPYAKWKHRLLELSIKWL